MSLQWWSELYEKMLSLDADFRFMAISDVTSFLSSSTNGLRDQEKKLVEALIKLLSDSNAEVISVAVKSMVPLASRLASPALLLDKLLSLYLTSTEASTKDIAVLALKSVIAAQGPAVTPAFIAKLLVRDADNDTIDIVADCLVSVPPSPAIIDPVLQWSLPLLSHPRIQVTKTLVATLSGLTRSSPRYTSGYVREIWAVVKGIVGVVEEGGEEGVLEGGLQCLESLVGRCVGMGVYANEVERIGVEFIKYDPNYVGDDDEDMDLDDEDEDQDEEGYSDDEDMSWKCRKAASRLLATVISTRPEAIKELLKNVGPVLVSRFNEREESVRLDVYSTFIGMLRMVEAACSTDPKSADSVEMRKSLEDMVPKLAKSLGKQMKGSSTQTRQVAFSLLRHVVQALDERIDAGVFSNCIVAPVLAALGDSTNSSVKIEALLFLAAYFQRPGVVQDGIDEILDRVIASCADKYYKITVQALIVLDSLVKVGGARKIYECVIKVCETGNADVEVKERALVVLGSLLQHARGELDVKEVEGRVLPLLVERVGNEVTRLVTLRVLTRIVGGGGLEGIVDAVVGECVICMRQSGRQVLIASLECLVGFVKMYLRGAEAYSGVISQGAVLLGNNADPAVFCLLLEVCNSIIAAVGCDIVGQFKDLYVEALLQIALTSPHMFSGSGVMRQFGLLWRGLVVAGAGTGDGGSLVRGLVKEIKGFAIAGQSAVEKQAFPVVAHAIVSVCCFEDVGETVDVPEWFRSVQREIAGDVYREVCEGGKKKVKAGYSEKYLGLLILGEIGQRMDILGICPGLDKSLLEILSESGGEDIKHYAAVSLGNVALGSLGHYMPVILGQIRGHGKDVYLLLLSLREIIAKGAYPTAARYTELAGYSSEIWALLFDIVVIPELEEGTRNVIAECLGRLCAGNPATFLPEMVKMVKGTGDGVKRASAVSAVRFMLSLGGIEGGEGFGEMLEGCLVEFIKCVQDAELVVRRAAIQVFISAVTQKTDVVRGKLHELLPLLYSETVIRPELVHIVDMGPFKHIVDDGMENRKNAYSCMGILLEKCRGQVEMGEFCGVVVKGMSDTSQEVNMMCHLLLTRLVGIAPDVVGGFVEEIVDPLKKSILLKSKENAVKQERERNDEIVRSGVRVGMVLEKGYWVKGVGKLGELVEGVFDDPESQVKDVVKAIRIEMEGKEKEGGAEAMDTS